MDILDVLFARNLLPMKVLKVNLDLLINLIFKAVAEIFINLTLELVAIKSNTPQFLTIFQVPLNLMYLYCFGVILEPLGALFLSGEGIDHARSL
jgi:hypothetical protein